MTNDPRTAMTSRRQPPGTPSPPTARQSRGDDERPPYGHDEPTPTDTEPLPAPRPPRLSAGPSTTLARRVDTESASAPTRRPDAEHPFRPSPWRPRGPADTGRATASGRRRPGRPPGWRTKRADESKMWRRSVDSTGRRRSEYLAIRSIASQCETLKGGRPRGANHGAARFRRPGAVFPLDVPEPMSGPRDTVAFAGSVSAAPSPTKHRTRRPTTFPAATTASTGRCHPAKEPRT